MVNEKKRWHRYRCMGSSRDTSGKMHAGVVAGEGGAPGMRLVKASHDGPGSGVTVPWNTVTRGAANAMMSRVTALPS